MLVRLSPATAGRLVVAGRPDKAADVAGKYLTPGRVRSALSGRLISRALDEKPSLG